MQNIHFIQYAAPISYQIPAGSYELVTGSKVLRYFVGTTAPADGDPAWLTAEPNFGPVITGPATVWLDADTTVRGLFAYIEHYGTGSGGVGPQGPAGADGQSAYEIALDNGFSGTEAAWLASLVGPAGAPGAEGSPGSTGAPGSDGAPGVGVPSGGTPGQILAKVSVADHNTTWVDPATGGSTDLADGNGRSIGDTNPFDYGYFDALNINGTDVAIAATPTEDVLWGYDFSATNSVGYTLGNGLSITGNVLSAAIGSDPTGKTGFTVVSGVLQGSQASYDALSPAQQNDGTAYLIV